MDLDDNPSRIVHRSEGEGRSNYWVIFLVFLLWAFSNYFYFPGMP